MSIPARSHKVGPSKKKYAVFAVLKEGKSVTEVAKELEVARKTIYSWIKRYREEGRVSEKYVSGFDHPNAISENQQNFILQSVVKTPELSIHRLAKTLGFSSHGIYNVLKRHGLTYKEERIAYAAFQREISQVSVLSRFFNRVKYVWEQFIPSLAPAPPPERRLRLLGVLKSFSVSGLTSFILSYSTLSWIRLLGAATPSQSIGLVFASTALLVGSFFFLYSFKYYITLAMVLSFSQSEGVQDTGEYPSASSGLKRKGLLSWLLGLNGNGDVKSRRIGTTSQGRYGNFTSQAVGLTPNLEHVRLKRKPYVSIHIPFYNEKNVVERSIASATNFDYPEYEVILCDDSTDETTTIIREYQKEHLAKGERLRTIENKKEGWTLTSVEVKPGVTLKHIHRTSRSGFKGGALKLALTLVDPRTEFVSVFDADFVPYPDTLELFLKYFQVTAGTLDFKNNNDFKNNKQQKQQKRQTSNIAAVQGYQWHVLNKSENWITKGVRSEYAGSYVIERSGREIYGALKQISGAVYMIRRDVLEEVGWETSITEDFQLTLKLYEKGYKVVFTPYIQAPAECVSTLKRLIRQRMRWAEGHSNNIRKMFWRLLLNPKLTLNEKLEFLYLSPYYLQAFFFLVGTISWLISETLFPARLPFWTSLWGWSLVLTNMLSLPLVNAVGLFLEESEEKDYAGLASFVALSYIVVPFQAYASLKGFLKGEGPWFRTPKTGKITDILKKGTFYRFMSGILPGRSAQAPIAADLSRLASIPAINQSSASWRISVNPHVALATANNTSTRLSAFSTFNSFNLKPKRMRWLGKVIMVFVLTASLLLHSMAFDAKPVEAAWYSDTNYQYRKKLTIDNTKVSGASNLSHFPVLVSYSDTDLRTTGDGGHVTDSNGYDIIFTDDDKTTKLDHEIESYSSTVTTGTIVMWVRFPTLPYNTDKDFYIYYGNSNISTSQESITGVWNENGANNYKAVWHFNESSGNRSDSTSNGNTLSDSGTVPACSSNYNIAGCADFEKTNSDYLDITDGNQTGLDLDNTDYTISFWAWTETTYGGIIEKFDNAGDPDGYYLDFRYIPSQLYVFTRDFPGTASAISTATNSIGTWEFWTAIHDDSADEMVLCKNGSCESADAFAQSSDGNTQPFEVGHDNSFLGAEYYDGMLDELRVATTERSTDWIATTYNNQSNQGTGAGKFIKTLGSEVFGGFSSGWQYRFKYTITNSGVGETLTDFPLHIDLTNDAPANFWTHVSSETGDDIRIVDEDDTTDLSSQAHLEGFSKASSKGHIWVKRTITANVSTEYVWIYYGNSGASSPFSDTTKQNTYNSGYVGLWHLDETSGTHYDATSNNNDSTLETVTQQGADIGKIDGADEFDGVNDEIDIPHNSSINPSNNMTVELWVNLDELAQTQGIQTIIKKAHSGDPWLSYKIFQSYEAWLPAETFNFVWKDASGTAYSVGGDYGGLSTGTDYYLAGVRDGATLDLYLNADNSSYDWQVNPDAGDTLYDSDTQFAIGSEWGTRYADGIIDEVRISNTNRSAEWIEFAYLSDKGDAGTAGSEEEVPEMVVLLLPVVLLVPLIVKHYRKKKERLAFARAY